MNLKLIYILIYAIYGFLAGMILSLVFVAVTAGIFWLFIFGDNPWPAWSQTAMLIVFYTTLVATIAGGIFFGVKRTRELKDQEVDQAFKKRVFKDIVIAYVVLMLFVGFVSLQTYIVGKKRNFDFLKGKEYQTLVSSLRGINALNIYQAENHGLGIAIEIKGDSPGTYQLNLDLVASGYIKEKLIEKSESVQLKFSNQTYHFIFPFQEIASRYRRALTKVILSFDKRFSIDEHILIAARLKLLESDDYSEEEIQAMNLPVSRSSAVVRFLFSCQDDGCEITQE